VNGRYMSDTIGYEVKKDGFISIKNFTDDELHAIG
jgi:hypothetical protein